MQGRPTQRRPILSMPAAVFLAVVLLVGLVGSTASPVAAQDDGPRHVYEVTGRGWGHARGMGQWGAQGYALDHGWSAAQILDHFYPNTTASTVGGGVAGIDPARVRVEIRQQRSTALRVTLHSGRIRLLDGTGGTVDVVDPAAGQAVRVRTDLVSGLIVEFAATCGGPWGERRDYPGVGTIELVAETSASGPEGLLRVCHDDGNSTWYAGSLRGVTVDGSTRTVNVVSIEQYLHGVVPKEVPASWQAAALQAQAVAARSYALAGDPRQQPYADTCDTTLCQVYSGRYRKVGDGAITDVAPEWPIGSGRRPTTEAVDATAGVIRRFGDGSVARTEFSASTGGYTIDAADRGGFPAVVDDGDDTAANPHRSWNRTVVLDAWVAAQGMGELLSVSQRRTGNGDEGGHVVDVRFDFEDGTRTLTGDQVRSTFSLKSTWFTFRASAGSAADQNLRYVDALYELFLRRPPDERERADVTGTLLDGTPRFVVTRSLAASPEWAGVEIDALYEIVFGRPADDDGRAFWLRQMTDGRRLQSVAAEFYGSPEFYARSGSDDRSFVGALYREIQQREPDAAGLAFWTAQLGDGRRTRAEVAAGFYASPESRERRVRALYDVVLGRAPDGAGLAFWMDQLLRVDDVALAAELASSDEFFDRSQR